MGILSPVIEGLDQRLQATERRAVNMECLPSVCNFFGYRIAQSSMAEKREPQTRHGERARRRNHLSSVGARIFNIVRINSSGCFYKYHQPIPLDSMSCWTKMH